MRNHATTGRCGAGRLCLSILFLVAAVPLACAHPKEPDGQAERGRPDGNSWQQTTPKVVFGGRTFFLSEGNEGMPAGLRRAFTYDANEAKATCYLLSVAGAKVLDALCVPGARTAHLADLAGNGTWQVVLDPLLRPTGDKLKIKPLLMFAFVLRPDGVSQGFATGPLRGIGSCTAYSVGKDGKFGKLFHDDWDHTHTAYTSGAGIWRDASGKEIGRTEVVRIGEETIPVWADLTGTGKPVRCQVAIYHRTHIPGTGKPYDTIEHILKAYWQCDPSGKWRVVEDGRKIPIGASGKFAPNSLRGLLTTTQPATQSATRP